MLCEYGCGQKATYQFKNGKWCCSKSHNKCPFMINIQSLNKIGKNNPFYNKKHSIKNKENYHKNMLGNNHKKLITISEIKKKYPTFAKVEEMRYNPDIQEEIQVRCKNHLCKNSKEQGGWFTPTYYQRYERINDIEHIDGNGGSYMYCCDECKQECPLFNLRGDPNKIKKEQLYTSEEYQTFRQQVLKREAYICEYCEQRATHVHHSRPQKLEPGFVLDPDFGVACCESCHYKYGHKDECSTGNLANIVCV